MPEAHNGAVAVKVKTPVLKSKYSSIVNGTGAATAAGVTARESMASTVGTASRRIAYVSRQPPKAA
jgi:hypothetical protein